MWKKFIYSIYYGGKTTDEKNIWLQGVIDTNCRFVKKLQINFKED